MILDLESVDRDLDLEAEACVVGSGAGGSVAAAALQAAGVSTIVIEEGAYLTSRDLNQREEDMYIRLYRERGSKPTADFAVLVSQGRAVGGSTLVSQCVCVRPPRQILEHWRTDHAVEDLDFQGLFPHVQAVERAIGVVPMGAAEMNENNRLLAQGGERLGYRGRLLHHNRHDCLKCGYCVIGCTYDRKGDALGTHLADASRRGARILPRTRIERVTLRNGAAVGVEGRVRGTRDGKTRGVRVRAPIVVIAAGALESPLLWIRSGLPDRGDVVGKNLRLNPQVVVAGLFERPVRSWDGIPQSYVVEEFLNLDKSIEGGWLTFAAAAQPVATAALLPGIGADHESMMARYAHLGAAAIVLHDRTAGEVRVARRGRARIHYELGEDDRRDLREGLRRTSEILFAAEATEVVLPYNDHVRLSTRDELRIVDERGILANDPLLLSFHPQGTLRMGADPRRAAVSPHGQVHGVQGVWVADASVLPTSVAVPPQITIMALASRTAAAIIAGR